jgi:hypothetical protein
MPEESIFATNIEERRNDNTERQIERPLIDYYQLTTEAEPITSYLRERLTEEQTNIFKNIRFRDLNEESKLKFVNGFVMNTNIITNMRLTKERIKELLEATNPIITEGIITNWRNNLMSRAIYYANKHNKLDRIRDLRKTTENIKY